MACIDCRMKGFKVANLSYCGRREDLVLPCYECNDDDAYFAELQRRTESVGQADPRPKAQVVSIFRKRAPPGPGPSGNGAA